MHWQSQSPPKNSAGLRYRALLEVTSTIAQRHDLDGIVQELTQRLLNVVNFDYVYFLLHDPDTNRLNANWVASVLHDQRTNSKQVKWISNEEIPKLPIPKTLALDEAPAGWVWEHQKPILYPDITRESSFPRVLNPLRAAGLISHCVLPLTHADARLGAVSFMSRRESAYDEADVEFLQHAAEQLAAALRNASERKAVLADQERLAAERDRLRLLLELNNVLVSNLDLHALFPAISECLRRVVRHDYASVAVLDPPTDMLRVYALVFPEGKGLVHEEMIFTAESSPAGWALKYRKPLIVDPLATKEFPGEITTSMMSEGVRCACWLPLIRHKEAIGTLSVASLHEHAFGPNDLELLGQVANQVAIALENALAFRQIAALKDKLAQERLYLEQEIRSDYNFEEIMGESTSLHRILQQVETVAVTNATVLVLGETGTGKELIARAIHNRSPRRAGTFVRLNCAAVPAGLLESELFGHEKGAFTGAVAQKLGRIELAHQGTLFLDEVGDIPLELQPKLLRVLQEREFERLGSTRSHRVDTRVVAATNRDLAQMVAAGTFRRDLFYRLNVFPVRIPPLRERRDDIPILVRYFAQKFSRAMNRTIESIPSEIMDVLMRWHWPGNVRELENLIERSVILSSGSVLNVPISELKLAVAPTGTDADRLDEAQREHILRVMRETAGVIGGPEGAAARLGLKRTTLHSKLKKLGIQRDESDD